MGVDRQLTGEETHQQVLILATMSSPESCELGPQKCQVIQIERNMSSVLVRPIAFLDRLESFRST